jgi:hypothetical protein
MGHCWTYAGCYAWEDGAISQRKPLSLPNPLVLIDENAKELGDAVRENAPTAQDKVVVNDSNL